MFWGLVLEPGKRYSTVVEKSFHLSKAALDCASVKRDNEIHKVILEAEDQENLLCSLSKEKGVFQVHLDLNFMTGDSIAFECKGSGTVHLSGYLAPDELEMEGEEDEEEQEDDSEESELEIPALNTNQPKAKNQQSAEKRKLEALLQQNKKKKTLGSEKNESNSESDDESNEDDEMESDEDDVELGSDEDEEGDSEEEEESDEQEKEVISKKRTQQPIRKQKNLQQQQPNSVSPQNKQTPGKANKPNVNGVTPNQQQSGKKDKKKGQTPQTTPVQNATTPKSKTPGSSEEETHKKKIIQGGVIVKDIKIGSGQPVAPGKTVEVYYIGRTKANNKIFDSVSTKGDPFKFKLGKGEVIKGWDIGIQGMKVGGKRVITCPPNVAYGSKGMNPKIPPNSTLIFEVDLKSSN